MPYPKKPKALKILQGTARPCRTAGNEFEAVAVRSVPLPPDWLGERGRQAWNIIAGEFVEKGMLSWLDLPMLEILCDNLEDYHECREKMKKAIGQDRLVLHNGKRKAAEVIIKIGIQFGLMPAARAKMTMPILNKINSLLD